MRLRVLLVTAALAACVPAEVLSVRSSLLGDDFLFLEGGGGNSVILTRGRATFVFDTKMWPFDHDVEQAVAEAHPDRLIVVNSHAHSDHTGGDWLFADALMIAAPDAVQELSDGLPEIELPRVGGVPSVPVAKEMHLMVGDEPVLLVHPGPAHTSGDLFAWFPRTGILLTGDLFDHGFYPHVDPGRGGTYLGLIAALEQLDTFPADVVIPGHGAKATRADVEVNLNFLRELRDAVKAHKAAGASIEAIVAELSPAKGEPLRDLGIFSSREKIVRGLAEELSAK